MLIDLDSTLLPAIVKEILLKGSGPNKYLSFSGFSKSVKNNKINKKEFR